MPLLQNVRCLAVPKPYTNSVATKTMSNQESHRQFDEWNEVKKKTDRESYPLYYEREVYHCRTGKNIGFEQSGKGERFLRPVLIIKKFNRFVFWGVPLSKTNRRGKYYYPFLLVRDITSVAILSQLKLYDAKRLGTKIGVLNKEEMKNIKRIIRQYLE